ncbi:MAG TPA: Druantia anti-phage system protein DruA [Chitinophagaceae bacterium]|nr:Druantia anti-phage system protein DruA [Chitinophagaceae bacterium]
MNQVELYNALVESLTNQGFHLNGHLSPKNLKKESFKKIQGYSKKEQLVLQKDLIESNYDLVSEYLIDGSDINPENIELELRLVEDNTIESKLYRWWNLVWWTVPYQKAYGRQMRFLLWDKTHNAPFGLIGLQSPILRMAVRDEHLNIPKEDLDYIINKSMQAQRLGALPPYNKILGGKMVALSVTSNEVRKAYNKKYKGVTTLMEERVIEPQLLFITTTSAFGKSSIYNRLKYDGIDVAESLGYTKGAGSFHITEELYAEMLKFLKRRKINVDKSFGNGPSRKVKLISQAFALLGLREYQYHNIEREFFLFPIARNLENVIENGVRPVYHQRKLSDLTDFWKERWAIPRSIRNPDWNNFDARQFMISTKRNVTRWSNQ